MEKWEDLKKAGHAKLQRGRILTKESWHQVFGVLAVIALSLVTLHKGLAGGLQAKWPTVTFIIVSAVVTIITWITPREISAHIC
jgi:hypothetical protein